MEKTSIVIPTSSFFAMNAEPLLFYSHEYIEKLLSVFCQCKPESLNCAEQIQEIKVEEQKEIKRQLEPTSKTNKK